MMSMINNRLTESDLVAALREYLPASLERQCLSGDAIKDPRPCLQHLDALLRAISTYLPRQVVAPLIENPEMGRVRGGFNYGSVMFADISGFTAMSETLSQLGKEGAEEVTAIINRLFTTLLSVADRYGGDLLKFGGDALLLFFGDEAHALSACRAALDMQETMAQFSETATSQGVFRLRMSVGVGTGPLFMAHLGASSENVSQGMEFTVMGQAMTQMAQAESRASAGEIFIDDQTREALQAASGGKAALQAVEDAPADKKGAKDRSVQLHQLLDLPGDADDLPVSPLEDPLARAPSLAEDNPRPWIEETVRRIRALSLFLPPGLLDKIKLEPERVAIGGEYRPVTIFFANFYGINEIIETLGEARSAEITAILNAHFATMREIIARYGGVVNKVDTYAVGHRIMALFGAPRAHIDDPERAVRAALDMQAAMDRFAELETSCGAFSLKQRIGINTGLVFAGNVGSLARQEYSVMGDEVNLAARLMGAAAEEQVLISQSTARQSAGVFLLQEQAPVRVKGKSKPVANYDAVGVQERRAPERRPIIGRDAEWAVIHARTDQALGGEAQIITLVGNAGLGKSRFLEEVVAHWREEHSALSVGASCPSFGRHTPYLPWLDVLRLFFGLNPADTTPVKLDKIEALLQEVDPTWRDWTVLMGRLLGLDVEETALIRALDAQTRQRIIFNVVGGLVKHIAGEQPLLLAIDDIQWADETSVELINHVAQQVTERPFLLALAHRPEESLALDVADLPHHIDLRLEELSDDDSLRLLDTLLPTTPQMPQQLKALILKNAQGNPLFIEAVAHSLIENYLTLDEESGAYHARADLATVEVPDSVNRVIMSRIDRLDESSRNVLKVASVIGQEFRYWLLSEIYPHRRGEGELRERLDQLSRREILEGPLPDLLYLFRHILTREVAYESLLYADRRQLHRHIGQSIERQQAQRLNEYWEVLAYHFDLAEDWGKAMGYHLKAGRKAQEMYANEDAVHHYRRALEDAERVEDGERLSRRQLAAHEGLAEVLDTLGKYDEALAHLEAARGLAPEAARRQADLCRKTAYIYEKKSDYNVAFEWLHKGLESVEGMEVIEAARLYLRGAGVYQRQGKNNEAIEWCNRGLKVAERVGGREGQSVIAHADYLLGLIYYRLGDMAHTIELCRKSMDIYELIEDMPGASQASTNLANAYLDRGGQGDWARGIEYYLRALNIKRKIGDIYGQAVITLNLGSAYLDQGNLSQAANYNQQSLRTWEILDSIYMVAVLYNNMSAVTLRKGKPDGALALLEKSLKMFQQIGSRDFLPEVYRHQAEAYIGQRGLDKALNSAQRSLELAQEQEMRLEEGATRRVLGQVHLARGELAQAEQELEESLRILEELNSRYEVGKTCFQLARLYHEWQVASGKLQVASGEWREYLERARGIFEDLGAQWDLAQVENTDWQD
jgi:class 3 adenylate cyclase/tetratricopeptide (TPR) repeat protein